MKWMDELKACSFCGSSANRFLPLRASGKYSGIEIAINPQGMLRVRVYDDESLKTQDIVHVEYCPMCGRKFKEESDG